MSSLPAFIATLLIAASAFAADRAAEVRAAEINFDGPGAPECEEKSTAR